MGAWAASWSGPSLSAVYGMVAGRAAGRTPGACAIGNANETAASLVAGGTLAAALAFALRGKPVLRLACDASPCRYACSRVFLTLSRGGLWRWARR